MNDSADHAAVVDPVNPTHVRRQMRLDPSPLLITQPKKLAAHDPILFQSESGSYGIKIAFLPHHF
jgi:hypothetical protein